LRADWNRLLESAGTNKVFMTFEWMVSWWECYREGKHLKVLVLKDSHGIRAIAPLMLTGNKFFRRLSLIGGYRPDYNDFIVRKGNERDYRILLDYLHDRVDGWDEILLENVPEESALFGIVEGLRDRFLVKVEMTDVCPYIRIGGNSEGILRLLAQKEAKRSHIRKLRKAGELRFRHISNEREMDEALNALIESHARRYHADNIEKALPIELSFHKKLLKNMFCRNNVKFCALELDCEPIAKHFGFGYNNVYYWVKPSFEERYAEYSPGVVMLYFAIKYAVTNGYEEFDFLRGREHINNGLPITSEP